MVKMHVADLERKLGLRKRMLALRFADGVEYRYEGFL